MLIKLGILQKIVDGEVDLAFRRWIRATVKAGGKLRTPVGELAIEEVTLVCASSLTQKDAQRAGYDTLAHLKSDLARYPDRDLYRISLRYCGADQREVLREDDDIPDATCAEILRRIEGYDSRAPVRDLSLQVLEWIGTWPERRAQDLADALGLEKPMLKVHIRKLKELGLTESRQTGYRLSPRGRRLLDYACNRGVL